MYRIEVAIIHNTYFNPDGTRWKCWYTYWSKKKYKTIRRALQAYHEIKKNEDLNFWEFRIVHYGK